MPCPNKTPPLSLRTRSQVGFLEFLVEPLFAEAETIALRLGLAPLQLLQRCAENKQEWVRRSEQENESEPWYEGWPGQRAPRIPPPPTPDLADAFCAWRRM